jgi:hypothetical protein
MKQRSLILRILVIANALLITAAFVGCPSRRDPSIVTIAPAPIAAPPFVTIAPYGGNSQHSVPPGQTTSPASQDSKSDKIGP